MASLFVAEVAARVPGLAFGWRIRSNPARGLALPRPPAALTSRFELPVLPACGPPSAAPP
jgi:hypothetical protein